MILTIKSKCDLQELPDNSEINLYTLHLLKMMFLKLFLP